MNTIDSYIKDMVKVCVLHAKYDKLSKIFQKNNIDENEMINILTNIHKNDIYDKDLYENLLEYSDFIKSDFLLKKLIDHIYYNRRFLEDTPNFCKMMKITVYFLAYSKKIDMCINFVKMIISHDIIKFEPNYNSLYAIYTIGSKELLEIWFKNAKEPEIKKFFWIYNPRLLDSRKECDDFIENNELFQKYLPKNTELKIMINLIHKLQNKKDFETKCADTFVEIYKYVSENKEYFKL